MVPRVHHCSNIRLLSSQILFTRNQPPQKALPCILLHASSELALGKRLEAPKDLRPCQFSTFGLLRQKVIVLEPLLSLLQILRPVCSCLLSRRRRRTYWDGQLLLQFGFRLPPVAPSESWMTPARPRRPSGNPARLVSIHRDLTNITMHYTQIPTLNPAYQTIIHPRPCQ